MARGRNARHRAKDRHGVTLMSLAAARFICDGQAVAKRTLPPPAKKSLMVVRVRVMIGKFAMPRGKGESEFSDLNHASDPMTLAPFVFPKFAQELGCELRRTSESGH